MVYREASEDDDEEEDLEKYKVPQVRDTNFMVDEDDEADLEKQ